MIHRVLNRHYSNRSFLKIWGIPRFLSKFINKPKHGCCRVSEETDVPAETIVRLARDYSSITPSMIVQNMSGAQRTEHGAYVAGSQFYLALLTGNIGKRGRGL